MGCHKVAPFLEAREYYIALSRIRKFYLNVWQLSSKIRIFYVRSRRTKEDKYQESIQISTTPAPGYQWESDNLTIKGDSNPNDKYVLSDRAL